MGVGGGPGPAWWAGGVWREGGNGDGEGDGGGGDFSGGGGARGGVGAHSHTDVPLDTRPHPNRVYSLTGIATPCLTLRAKFRAPPLKRDTQSHRSLSAKATRHWSLRTPAYMRCAQGAGAPPDLVAARANGAQKTNSRSSRSFGRLPAAASSAGPSAYKTKSS